METLGLISFDPNGVFRMVGNRWMKVFCVTGDVEKLASIATNIQGRIRVIWHHVEECGRVTCHLILSETGEIYEEVRQLMSKDEESMKEAVNLTPLTVDEVMNQIGEEFGQSIRFSYASYVRGNKDWKKECFFEVQEEVNKFSVGRLYGEAFSVLAYPPKLSSGFADGLKTLGCQMYVCLDMNSLTTSEQVDFNRALEKRYNRRLMVLEEEDYLNASYSIVILCDSDDARGILEKAVISLANAHDILLSSSFYEQKKVAESAFGLGLFESQIMRNVKVDVVKSLIGGDSDADA